MTLDESPRNGAEKRVIYRAVALRVVLAFAGIFAGWSLTLADSSWRNTPALQLISSWCPLWVFGLLLFVYAALLLTDIGDMGRIAGYLMGAALSFYFSLSYVWLVGHHWNDKHFAKNGFVLAVLVDVIAFHIGAVKVTVERKKNHQ